MNQSITNGNSRLDVYEWLKAEMMCSTDITLEEFEEVLQMWVNIKTKELNIVEFENNNKKPIFYNRPLSTK